MIGRLPLARGQRAVRPAPSRGASPQGGGRPLPEALRPGLEAHFDRDLGRVRIHDDRETGQRVAALGAEAYAQGEHVYFAPGRYDPFSPDGRELIAHELTHVEQFYAGLARAEEPLFRDPQGPPAPAGRRPPCGLRIEARPAADPAFQGMEVEFYWTHDPIWTTANARYPRIQRKWELLRPDGEVERDWFTNPTFSRELSQVGQYKVSVWVEWARGEVYRLDHWQKVTTSAGHAAEQLPQLQTYEYVQFRVGVGLQHVSMARNCLKDQRAEGAWIECLGPNPTGWSHARNTYTVHPPPGATRFRWYVRLDSWEGIARENYYGYRPTTIGGERAFALPSSGRSADWPMICSGVNTIVCECLDREGRLLGAARYRQAVLRQEELERYQAYARYMQHADQAMAGIATGREVGTRTIYVNEETGKCLQLAIFVGPDARDPRRVKLVDLTPGVSRVEYSGASLQAALDDFRDGNAYPTGLVRVEVPQNGAGIPALTRDIRTTGESLWQAWSSGLGWASLGLVAVGVVAAFVPGGQVVAGVCFVAAAGTGAASGGLSLYDRLQQAEISARGVAIDVLGIASSILGGAGAIAFKGLKAGSAVTVAGRGTRFILWTGLSADLSGGVLIAWEGVEQIQTILASGEMSQGEKINSIVLVLSNLALNGGLLALSVRGAGQETRGAAPQRTAPPPAGDVASVEARRRSGARSGGGEGGAGQVGRRAEDLADDVARKTGVSTMAVTPGARARPGPVGAEVYLGFMDEEVNDILRHLREKYPDRPVLVVERSKSVSAGGIFERPWEYYGGKPAAQTTTQLAEVGDVGGLHGRLAQRMGEGLNKRELNAAWVAGQKAKTGARGSLDPTLWVGEFAPTAPPSGGVAAGPPVILVRAPELGLQPGLVGGYLRPILGGIQNELGPVRLHVFGAGGAVGKGITPGSRSRMAGSVFVGVRRVPGEAGVYEGVVALRSKDGTLKEFYRARAASTPAQHGGDVVKADEMAKKQAELKARRAFQIDPTNLREVDAQGRQIPGGRTLLEEVRAVQRAAKGGDDTVSLTVSFFGGGRDKRAGQALGLSDVNMEDFHVLQVADELKIDPRLVTVERVNADPSVIDHRVVERVQEWAREARLSSSDYTDAIEWGLTGAILEQMPAKGHWTVFDKPVGNSRLQDLVVPNQQGQVVNPYYTELAVDLVSEAADDGKALEPFRVSARAAFQQAQASPQVLEELDYILGHKLSRVSQLARQIKRGAPAETRAAIARFVEEIKYLDLEPESLPARLLDGMSAAERSRLGALGEPGRWRLPILADEQGDLKLWARPGKFPGLSQGVGLDQVLGRPVGAGSAEALEDAVDRALYKASNRPALMERAGAFIEGQLDLDQALGGGGMSGVPTPPLGEGGLSGPIRRKAVAGVLRMAGVPGGGVLPGVGGALVVRRPGLGSIRIQSLSLKWAPEAGGALHRKALDPAAGEVPTGVDQLIERSQGFALPLGLRERLERLLGISLGGVRVHTDPFARAAAEAVGAEAFTLGEDVFFARGRYDPTSQRGLMLLGHELTHVAQEQGGAPTLDAPAEEGTLAAPREAPGGLRVGAALDRLEQQAERNERAFQRLWRPGFGAHTPEPSAPAGAAETPGERPDRRAGARPATETPAGGALPLVAARAGARTGPPAEGAAPPAAPGPGLPLELGLRERLERALGADLGAVRLHTGLQAERMAAALEAQAITHGEHVFLGSGQGPESPGGLRVLAHEATHVVQAQRGRLVGPGSEAATRALEVEAYAAERKVARPAPRIPRESPSLLVRTAPEAREAHLPAAAVEKAPGGALRRSPEVMLEESGLADPVLRVMRAWSVQQSREEFLATLRDRLRELMAEELELEAERRETLAWSPFRPLA